MKRIVIFCLLAFLSLSLSACGNDTESETSGGIVESIYPYIAVCLAQKHRRRLNLCKGGTCYLHLVRQRDNMERQQIYFRGHTDAVTYLRKIKAI